MQFQRKISSLDLPNFTCIGGVVVCPWPSKRTNCWSCGLHSWTPRPFVMSILEPRSEGNSSKFEGYGHSSTNRPLFPKFLPRKVNFLLSSCLLRTAQVLLSAACPSWRESSKVYIATWTGHESLLDIKRRSLHVRDTLNYWLYLIWRRFMNSRKKYASTR